MNEEQTQTHLPRNIILLLIISLFISVGYNLTLYNGNQRQTQTINDLNEQITVQTPVMTLEEMSKLSPTTRYIDGAKIVSSEKLHLMDDRESHECVCDEDTAIYIPYDNVTLDLKFYLNPSGGYSQGIYLQMGNSYRNESGVLVEGKPEDQTVIYDGYSTHIYNATVWRTPVIWETSARNGESFTVHLEKQGWYTLSLWSPIHYSVGSMQKSGSMITRDNKDLPYPLRIESWLEFRVIKEGESVLFLIKRY